MRDLAKLMAEQFDVPAPATYLALLVQDLDGMGMFLSGMGASADGACIEADPETHAEVSRSLQRLAARQRKELEDPRLLGVPVYAGGDDLLAFTPAATALKAAQACHEAIPHTLPRASTAVLFFHYHAGLQSAIAQVRQMLEQAKNAVPGKHALAVGYLRRSGVSEVSVQPWATHTMPRLAEHLFEDSAAGLFGLFARGRAHPLSPRLAADLERDANELSGLWQRDKSVYRAELARLVRRHMASPRAGQLPRLAPHGSGAEHPSEPMRTEQAELATYRPRAAANRIADVLCWLGEHEYAMVGDGRPPGGEPVPAARVGVFLRQEAR
jgi:CRISPR-associated protein Cmr2